MLAVVLELSRRASETVVEIRVDELNKYNGITTLLVKPNDLFLKEGKDRSYDESTGSSVSVVDHLINFKQRYSRMRK